VIRDDLHLCYPHPSRLAFMQRPDKTQFVHLRSDWSSVIAVLSS
jgi:hypothetical protein